MARSTRSIWLLAAAIVTALCGLAKAQVPGPNINMVSGTGWPGGDPFLQRQDEPSIAVSTRNPLHLLAGSNDYRTVDLPGLPGGVLADGWLGLFKSTDGGLTWTSTLLPGYPQDTSPEGAASGLKNFDAAADPTMRAGANGLFYYSGIVLNRGSNALGKLFVARFLDNNDESADPIQYLDTVTVASGTASQFIDKPYLAVDIPRTGAAKTTIRGQTFAVGNVYLSFVTISGTEPNILTTVYLTRSTNGGATWSSPSKVSQSISISQGTQIAIDPTSGAVYLAWRRIKKVNSDGTVAEPDGIIVAKSVDMGRTFSFGNAVPITPFEQGTTPASFRTTMYPTIAVDGTGRVYLAWSQGGAGPNGSSRIVMTTSPNGKTSWTNPVMVAPSSTPAHQLMPAMTFAGGKLMIVYYDLREDSTAGLYTPISGSGGMYTESRVPIGSLAAVPPQPYKVFNQYIADAAPPSYDPLLNPIDMRHTIDVRVTQADPGATPAFGPSVRVSNYDVGSLPGSTDIQQLGFNVPNLPLFMAGTSPFLGDFIDIAGRTIIPTSTGGWTFNTAPSGTEVYHAVWTDNRNVFPPLDGDWTHYTPVDSAAKPLISRLDPTLPVPPCVEGQTGMRNQDIYTSSISQGLVAGSPGNSKGLSSLQRAVVVFVQNTLDVETSYRMTILNQPPGGAASLLQSSAQTTLDVTVAPQSSISRSVFVTSSDPRAQIQISVVEITAPGGLIVSNGHSSTVVLNSDATNPANPAIANSEIYTPRIANPRIANPQIANPRIANPQIANPRIANPQIANPRIANPQIANPQIANPQIANPQIANPQIANPQIANPQIANGSMTDSTWTITNTGNTTASYFVKLLRSTPAPQGFQFQLLIDKVYETPQAAGCDLGLQRQSLLVANIVDPAFIIDPTQVVTTDVDIRNADVKNASLYLGPGESADITLRTVGPNQAAVEQYVAAAVKPAAAAQAINTPDLLLPSPAPPAAIAGFDVATAPALPAAVTGATYTQSLLAAGGPSPFTWSVVAGTLPTGLSLDPNTGIISGSPTAPGNYTFTVQVTDAASNVSTRSMIIAVSGVVASTPRLSLLGQPTNTLPGGTIAPPVTVKAVDGSGNPLQGIMVTLTLGNNTSGGTLTGIATVPTDSTGIATFSNLSVVTPGLGYTLAASASDATPATSNPFDVVGTTTVLGFSAQPSSSASGHAISPAVGVKALDGTGAIVPGANVTISIGTKPCSAASLSGTLTAVTNAAGIATFADLSIGNGGFQYTLTASAGAATTSSSPFNIEGFCNAASMANPRYQHATILLRNGKVLVAGGSTSNQAELFDPVAGTFSATAGNMKAIRSASTMTLLSNGTVLIVGGENPGGVLASAEIFDPAANTFNFTTGSMTAGRSQHTATLLPNGKVLIVGGQDAGGTPLAHSELYDPGTGTFSGTGDLATARSYHTATLLPNGKVLVTGGNGGVVFPTDAELYDPTTSLFSAAPGNMSSARIAHTATLLPNGKVLIAGGEDPATGTLDTAEVFDPASGLFSPTVSPMNAFREYHRATLLPNGKILLTGGFDSGLFSAIADVELYDCTTNTFSATASMKVPRYAHDAVLLPDDRVLITGGIDPSFSPVASAELFYPDIESQLVPLVTDQTPMALSNTFSSNAGGGVLNQAGDYAFNSVNMALFLRRAGAAAPSYVFQTTDEAPGVPGSRADLIVGQKLNSSGLLAFGCQCATSAGISQGGIFTYDGASYHKIVFGS
ncbi:MAG: kelch repeat-containing protein, partial [Acidobacteriota bacterium]